jgi:membrane-associated phospholipid phosphatase
MKKVRSAQSIILIFATIITFATTIYIGNFASNVSTFYRNVILVNITFIGDAFFSLGIIFFMLFFFNKKKLASKLLVSTIITLTIVQCIKNILHSNGLQIFFEAGVLQNDGQNYFNQNMISSHTAMAFTLAAFFSMQFKKWYLTIAFFLIASIVAYTRIILVQESILSLLIGAATSVASTIFLYKLNANKIYTNGYFYKTRKESNGFMRHALRV